MSVLYQTGWIFTRHALQRMDEMGVLSLEVHQVLDNPELSYPTHDGGRGQERDVRVAGRLAIVIVRETRTVVTVLWHRGEQRTYLRPAA